MKILALVTDAYGCSGGIARCNRGLLEALCADQRISRITLLPRHMGSASCARPEKLRIVTAAAGSKTRFICKALQLALSQRDYSYILCAHIHLLPLAWLISVLTSTPIVLLLFGIEAWEPRKSCLLRWSLGRVQMLVSISAYTRDRFIDWAPIDQSRTKLMVLPLSIAADDLSPGEKNPELLQQHKLSGKTVLFTLARLAATERYKGIDQVLEVLPALLRERPDLHYLIGGDGSDKQRLIKRAASLGLESKVSFVGFIPEERKVDYIRLADAFVMPGSGEGFGYVYLEALACGVPVVGSLLDASQETLLHGELGVLVNPNNPQDLKNGILQALAQEKRVPEQLSLYSLEAFQQRVSAVVDALRYRG